MNLYISQKFRMTIFSSLSQSKVDSPFIKFKGFYPLHVCYKSCILKEPEGELMFRSTIIALKNCNQLVSTTKIHSSYSTTFGFLSLLRFMDGKNYTKHIVTFILKKTQHHLRKSFKRPFIK